MEQALAKFLDQFFNFKVFGKKVTIPYWSNKLDKKIYGPYGGKGTPKEILEATIEASKKENVNLKRMTSGQIYAFMKKNRIGLDCSGFAYQIFDFLDHQKGGDGIENSAVGVGGTGIRKTDADSLTNNINTLPVATYSQIKTGDLLRLDGGGHVAVIVKNSPSEIVYAHISGKTKIEGPHLGKIKIIEKKKGLEEQVWSELTNFHPNLGDGIRRLKIWA